MAATQVAIIGAGPAGLLLAHLLHAEGIACTVLEARSRPYVEARIRAGVLEATTVALARRLGVSEGLDRDGLVHHGFLLAIDGDPLRIDLTSAGGGVTVYGQTELTRDLIASALARGIDLRFDIADVALSGIDGASPSVSFVQHGRPQQLACAFIAGCDGFHGVSRRSIPADALQLYERIYPFGWLGLLADVPPCADELIYARHPNGFALASMRSPTRSRYYVQVPTGERIEDWSDDRFWDEVQTRLGVSVTRGKALEKSIAPLRSFVAEPLRHGRLFLAGDAAHIVPPTGAKGLNLAAADVTYLAEALTGFFRHGDETALTGYSARALARIWNAVRFSWWFTTLTHDFPGADAFDVRIRRAELAYLRRSPRAQVALAENYIGLPL